MCQTCKELGMVGPRGRGEAHELEGSIRRCHLAHGIVPRDIEDAALPHPLTTTTPIMMMRMRIYHLNVSLPLRH